MKLNATQEMHLRNVRLADESYKNAKKSALQRAREAALAEVHSYQAALDREVRLAHEAGVPNRRIGAEGMHTQDGRTVRESLARTEGVTAITEAETDPQAQRYSLNGAVLVVTLTPDELTEAMRAVNYEADTAPASAEFTLEHTARGARLKALSPETLDNYERNPAVYWTYEREAEALAWYAEHNEQKEAA